MALATGRMFSVPSPRPLAAERCPALIGAEGRIERIIGRDITRQQMAIDLLKSRVEPAFHRAAVNMCAEAKCVVTGLTLAKAVRIQTFEVRIDLHAIRRVKLP